jgi:hypothetical protein
MVQIHRRLLRQVFNYSTTIFAASTIGSIAACSRLIAWCNSGKALSLAEHILLPRRSELLRNPVHDDENQRRSQPTGVGSKGGT